MDQYCNFDEFDTFSNGGLPFTVRMCGSATVPSPSGGSFTVYEAEVSERKGDRKWHLSKRYSDFVLLHSLLKEVGYDVVSIEAALPPKKWFGNLEGDVIAFRQRALER